MFEVKSTMAITQLKTQNKPAAQESVARKFVIAIDGPSASGKGTLAKMMAERLGYAYLDTGALYRAVGLATLEMEGDPSNIHHVRPALHIIRRHLTPELLSNPALRAHVVSDAASKVAALPEVRAALLDYQRNFAKNPPGNVGGAVLDGRDIGTVVCPDADMKFFVTADAQERARRRYEDVKAAVPGLTQDLVLQDIQKRDQRDKLRAVAPTLAASDAYVLDTTALNPEAALDEAVAVIRSKFLSAIDRF